MQRRLALGLEVRNRPAKVRRYAALERVDGVAQQLARAVRLSAATREESTEPAPPPTTRTARSHQRFCVDALKCLVAALCCIFGPVLCGFLCLSVCFRVAEHLFVDQQALHNLLLLFSELLHVLPSAVVHPLAQQLDEELAERRGLFDRELVHSMLPQQKPAMRGTAEEREQSQAGARTVDGRQRVATDRCPAETVQCCGGFRQMAASL